MVLGRRRVNRVVRRHWAHPRAKDVKKPKTIGPVEFVWENERLSVRYSACFRRKSAIVLVIITAVAAGLLTLPVSAIVRGRFLEVITVAVFLLFIGGWAAEWAITGWIHWFAYGRRPLIIDLRGGICSIPCGLCRRRVVRVSDIVRVRVQRKRLEPDTDTHVFDEDRITLLLREGKEQRLWGRLGIPGDAEAVAREIAACLACKLERRPARYFSRES